MRKIICLIALAILVSGCPSTICTLSQDVANGTASVIASQCSCSNQAAIATSIETLLTGKNGCSAPPTGDQGVIASTLICPLVTGLLTQTIANGFPTAWGCTGQISCVQSAMSLVNTACNAIPL